MNMTQNANTELTTAQKIDAANNYFKNLVEKTTDRSGYNGYPFVVDKIVEFGAENIFYIGRDYKGLYHDDYCTFTYWNNVTGEMFTDEWTTAFAAPSFSLYTYCVFTFDEAIKLGLVDMNKIKEYNKKLWLKKLNKYKFENNYDLRKLMEDYPQFTPMVKVEKGRKWKGTGFLLDIVENVYQWGPSYGRGYNTSVSTTAKILSCEDFQIHYCNAEYIQILNAEEMENDLRSFAEKKIEFMFTYPNEYFNMKTFTWTLLESDYTSKHNDLMMLWLSESNSDVVKLFYSVRSLEKNAFDEKEYENKKKLAAKRAEKITGIVEWVNTSTDKETELGKMSLALHVLAK